MNGVQTNILYIHHILFPVLKLNEKSTPHNKTAYTNVQFSCSQLPYYGGPPYYGSSAIVWRQVLPIYGRTKLVCTSTRLTQALEMRGTR